MEYSFEIGLWIGSSTLHFQILSKIHSQWDRHLELELANLWFLLSITENGNVVWDFRILQCKSLVNISFLNAFVECRFSQMPGLLLFRFERYFIYETFVIVLVEESISSGWWAGKHCVHFPYFGTLGLGLFIFWELFVCLFVFPLEMDAI